jgi:hypothetical protein
MSEEVKKLDFKNYLNVYEFETVLPGSGETVKFRPITTGQLKRLLVYENEKNPMMIEKALDELISSSIISEGFNINKVYLQDRFFLLVEIRRKSKGDNYSFQYNCPQCKSQSLQVIKLSDLNVKRMPINIDNVVKLDDRISVRVSHITRGKQKEAYGNIKDTTLNDSQRVTEMALYTHAAAIDGILIPEGEITDASLTDRKYLLENVPTEAYTAIRDWFTENDFGMDFTYTIKCNSCNYSEKIDIPVENFFF